MRVKKLVSLLLAVMLVVGMVPLNASAATYTATAANDVVQASLMVSKSAPTGWSGEGVYFNYDNDYKALYEGENQAAARKTMKDFMDEANATWDGSEEPIEAGAGELVYLGFKVNLDPEKQQTRTGLTTLNLVIYYDEDVLMPVHGDSKTTPPAQKYDLNSPMKPGKANPNYTDSSFQAGIVMNPVYDTDNINWLFASITDYAELKPEGNYVTWLDDFWRDVCDYGGQMELDAKQTKVYQNSTNTEYTGVLKVSISPRANNLAPSLSAKTTWDFVVPMMVRGTDDTGSLNDKTFTNISYALTSVDGKDKTAMGVSDVTIQQLVDSAVESGSTTLTGSQVDYNGENGYDANITANEARINIEKKEPALTPITSTVKAVTGTDTTEIKVKANKYAQFIDKTTVENTSKWSVKSKAATTGATDVTATVSKVEYTAANGENPAYATLTVTGLAAGTVTVSGTGVAYKVTNNVADTTAAVNVATSGITAMTPPTAGTVTANDDTNATAYTVNANKYYKLGHTATSYTKAVDTTGTALTVAQIIAAMEAADALSAEQLTAAGVSISTTDGVITYTGLLSVAADDKGVVATPVTLKRYAKPSLEPKQPTNARAGDAPVNIDFTTGELSVSGYTVKQGTTELNNGDYIAQYASQAVTVTKSASGDIFGNSAEFTLPARETMTGDEMKISTATTSEAYEAAVVDGKTLLTNAKAGDIVEAITTDGGTAPTKVEDFTDAAKETIAAQTVNNSQVTTNLSQAVKGTTAQTLYGYRPGKNGTATVANNVVTATALQNSTFPSVVKNIGGGVGNTFATVDFPTSLSIGNSFELTLHNGTWNSTATTIASNITLTKKADSGDTTITGLTATVNENDSKKVTITLPTDTSFAVSESYTIEVAKAALASGDIGSASGTSQTSGTINVVSDGVQLTIKDSLGKTYNTTPVWVDARDDSNKAGTYTFELSPSGGTDLIADRYVNETTTDITGTWGSAKVSGTTVTYTVDTTKYTDTTTGAKSDTITISAYKKAVPDTFTAKTWNGKTDYTESVTWKNAKNNASITVTTAYAGTFTLEDTYVGSKSVSYTKGTLSDADGEYTVEAGSGTVTVKTATVSAIELDNATVAPGTIEDVAKALADAEIVKVTAGTNDEAKFTAKLGTLLDATKIESILLDQIKSAAFSADAQNAAKEAAKAQWITDYKAYLTENEITKTDEEIEAVYAAGDTDATEFAKASNGDTTYTNKTDLETGAVNGLKTEIAAWDNTKTIENGREFSITLPYILSADFGSGASVAASAIAAFSGNVDTYDASAESLTINARAYQSTGGGGSYGPSIVLVTDGFGTADDVVQLDENGKITKLPGVLNQKLGTVFKGWATQPGNANTIVKIGREVTTDTTLYAIFEGYMSGDTVNGKKVARPNDSVTRGELVTMLVRAAGIYDATIDYTTTFADAKDGWYAPYIGCAETAGIFTGDAEGTARPKDAITREEAAILIAKAFKVNVAINGTTEYVKDFASVSDWASDYVAAIVNNGTSIGYAVDGGYEFQAKNEITRAEVAAMINKYIGLTEELKSSLAEDETVKSPFTDVQNRKSWIYANMVFATMNAPASSYVTEVTMPTRSK